MIRKTCEILAKKVWECDAEGGHDSGGLTVIQDPKSTLYKLTADNAWSGYVTSSNVGSSWAIKWISGIGLVCHDNHNNNFGI